MQLIGKKHTIERESYKFSPDLRKPRTDDIHQSEEGVQRKYLGRHVLNPLHPGTNSHLRFMIDTKTDEEIKTSGLDVRVIKENTLQSYKRVRTRAIERKSIFFTSPSKYTEWIRNESLSSIDNLFPGYSCYIIEMNISDNYLFRKHLTNNERKASDILHSDIKKTVGFLSFNVDKTDHNWINVHGLYVIPEYQGCGIGTLLIRVITGIGLSNNLLGIEFSNPFLYKSSGFYEHKGMQLFSFNSRHNFGCAQLRLKNDDGTTITNHSVLPRSTQHPLDFIKLKSPDLAGII